MACTFVRPLTRAEHQFFFFTWQEFTVASTEVPRDSLYYCKPGKDPFDLTSESLIQAKFLEDWLLRTCELVGLPARAPLILKRWWIQHEKFPSLLDALLAYYYNLAAQEDRERWLLLQTLPLPVPGIVEMERGRIRRDSSLSVANGYRDRP